MAAMFPNAVPGMFPDPDADEDDHFDAAHAAADVAAGVGRMSWPPGASKRRRQSAAAAAAAAAGGGGGGGYFVDDSASEGSDEGYDLSDADPCSDEIVDLTGEAAAAAANMPAAGQQQQQGYGRSAAGANPRGQGPRLDPLKYLNAEQQQQLAADIEAQQQQQQWPPQQRGAKKRKHFQPVFTDADAQEFNAAAAAAAACDNPDHGELLPGGGRAPSQHRVPGVRRQRTAGVPQQRRRVRTGPRPAAAEGVHWERVGRRLGSQDSYDSRDDSEGEDNAEDDADDSQEPFVTKDDVIIYDRDEQVQELYEDPEAVELDAFGWESKE
jgi:hypothetical protein